MKMPWPLGVVAAAITFVLFQLILPGRPSTALSQGIVPVIQMVGWFFTAMFLLAAFFSFLTQVIQGKRFKTTTSIAEIRSLGWKEFETYIGEFFRQRGYFVVETPEGPDNGVDLVLRKDGEKTYVQCKHWKTNQVGVEKVRELLGSIAAGGAHAGIFVTSGSYTEPARKLAQECGICLIDGDQLARMIPVEKSIHSDSEITTPGTTEMACPLCGARLVHRIAKRGRNKGNAFWGCSKYPACRGTRNV